MFQPLPVFVGLRYVRTRSRGFFVSFISWVSMLGVCLGVAALITIISVMNGFEGELRNRLVALTAHATVEGPAELMRDWRSVAEARTCRARHGWRSAVRRRAGHGRPFRLPAARGAARRRPGRGTRRFDHRGAPARGQARGPRARLAPRDHRAGACVAAWRTGRRRNHRDGARAQPHQWRRAARTADVHGGRAVRGRTAGSRRDARDRVAGRRRGTGREGRGARRSQAPVRRRHGGAVARGRSRCRARATASRCATGAWSMRRISAPSGSRRP